VVPAFLLHKKSQGLERENITEVEKLFLSFRKEKIEIKILEKVL
jgi:hypothetical protein